MRAPAAPFPAATVVVGAAVLNAGLAMILAHRGVTSSALLAFLPLVLVLFGMLVSSNRTMLLAAALGLSMTFSVLQKPLPIPVPGKLYLADVVVILAVGTWLARRLTLPARVASPLSNNAAARTAAAPLRRRDPVGRAPRALRLRCQHFRRASSPVRVRTRGLCLRRSQSADYLPHDRGGLLHRHRLDVPQRRLLQRDRQLADRPDRPLNRRKAHSRAQYGDLPRRRALPRTAEPRDGPHCRPACHPHAHRGARAGGDHRCLRPRDLPGSGGRRAGALPLPAETEARVPFDASDLPPVHPPSGDCRSARRSIPGVDLLQPGAQEQRLRRQCPLAASRGRGTLAAGARVADHRCGFREDGDVPVQRHPGDDQSGSA